METLIIRMGSSSTTIYREGEGIVLKEASLVAVSGDGKEQVVKAVGDRAKYMQGRTTGDTHVVSPIYEGVINDTELATIMLGFFLNKIYGKSLFRPKICAILSVPIGISLSERKAFEKVCYNAKILDVELIPNVFCGALGMNLDIHTPRGVMVVNIGGTTTNVAVLGLNNILSGACICLGGKNIDVAIENEIKNKFKMKIGDGSAEKIKIEVGSLYVNDSLQLDVEGVDTETKGSRVESLYSRDVINIFKYYIDKIALSIESVLSACTPDIINDIKKDGVYVYGGGSKITGLEYYLKQRLGFDVNIVDENGDIEIFGGEKLLDNPKQLEVILKNI